MKKWNRVPLKLLYYARYAKRELIFTAYDAFITYSAMQMVEFAVLSEWLDDAQAAASLPNADKSLVRSVNALAYTITSGDEFSTQTIS